MKRTQTYILALALALLTACALLAPQNLSEGLMATETAATTARQVGENAALAGKLTKPQAQFVQRQADLVVASVKAARGLTNPAAVQNKYDEAAGALRALQQFLTDQGVSK